MTTIESVEPATGSLTAHGATLEAILEQAAKALQALFPEPRRFRITSLHATPYLWSTSTGEPALWNAEVGFEEIKPDAGGPGEAEERES